MVAVQLTSLPGVLKGTVNVPRSSQAGAFERSSTADAAGLNSPMSRNASRMMPASLPSIIAAATAAAAADKDVSVRRGSRFFNGPASSTSFSGVPLNG